MGQFLLILHDEPTDFENFSPEQMQGIVAEYEAWRSELEAQGKLLGANKLADEGGRLLSRDGDDIRVIDGPYAEAKEVIGGYFAIVADGYDEAVEITKGCPHLTYGLRIELREIEQH